MATAFCGDSKTTFSHGSASGPSAKSRHPRLLAVLRRIESRGALETAHRALQNCGQVFRYAVATGRAERDPTGDLRGALPPPKEKHHASIIDPKRIAELLRAIDAYQGYLRDQMRASARPAGIRPAGRIAASRVAGDRSGEELNGAFPPSG